MDCCDPVQRLGRHADALAAAQEAADDQFDLFLTGWALPELIEASVRLGRTDAAAGALGRLIESTTPAGTDWALGIEARSRALVDEGDSAEGHYQEAVDRLARTRFHPELARTHLLYGEWLRAEGRRADARLQLRTAHDLLTTIGMEAFAERARIALVATGEKARAQSVDQREPLTAQEEHIARLALEGLSNPEIGARLFLSHRTVEWHLHKVFTKLGVSSRRELRNVVLDREDAQVTA